MAHVLANLDGEVTTYMKVVKKDQNKQTEYYKVVDGKTIKISEAEYFANNKEK